MVCCLSRTWQCFAFALPCFAEAIHRKSPLYLAVADATHCLRSAVHCQRKLLQCLFSANLSYAFANLRFAEALPLPLRALLRLLPALRRCTYPRLRVSSQRCMCQSFARLSPCSARPRSAVPIAFLYHAPARLLSAHPCLDHALPFPSRDYSLPPRLTAPPRPRFTSHCYALPVRVLTMHFPGRASPCESMPKLCFADPAPAPCTLELYCAIASRSYALPMRNRSKQCPLRIDALRFNAPAHRG